MVNKKGAKASALTKAPVAYRARFGCES